MTKIYSMIALLLFTTAAFSQAPRRLITATTSGSWTSASTWTTTGSPTTPGNNDSVVIAQGVSVNISGNGITLPLTNSVLDIFGTLVFNEPAGSGKTNDLNITTTTALPVALIRLSGTATITKGTDGNGTGNINVVVNGGSTQIKYSTNGVAGVPPGQTAGPTITGPAFAQNTTGNPQYFTTGSAASLPVLISLFKASNTGTNITLNWTSQQETNSRFYIIEKSANGSNWQEIGTVAAAGFSGMATNYQFSDDKAAEVNYYRIKMVDNDGKYSYTTTLTVRSQNRAVNVSLFPNPTSSSVNISIGQGLAQQGFTIHVMNHNGQVLARRQILDGTSALSFDVSGYKSGTYTVEIIFANGVRDTHKLVVIR